MPPHDIEIIHGRISDLKDSINSLSSEVKDSIAELTTEVRAQIAICKVCSPKVLGNGGEGLDSRLARVEETVIPDGRRRIVVLEEAEAMRKWVTTKIVAVCAVVASIVGTIVTLATHWLGKSS